MTLPQSGMRDCWSYRDGQKRNLHGRSWLAWSSWIEQRIHLRRWKARWQRFVGWVPMVFMAGGGRWLAWPRRMDGQAGQAGRQADGQAASQPAS